MDVGKRITYFRQQKDITVNKLANLSGISQSYLRDIELGKKHPTIEYLEYICSGLGISLKTFFDTEAPDPLEVEIAKLSPEQKEKLAEFIRLL